MLGIVRALTQRKVPARASQFWQQIVASISICAQGHLGLLEVGLKAGECSDAYRCVWRALRRAPADTAA
eukprot:2119481-Lingulodinium_polyedra.AAC.1